jgi:hypothetical protein
MGAAVARGHDAQRAVVAVGAAEVLFLVAEAGGPDERAVAEDPQVAAGELGVEILKLHGGMIMPVNARSAGALFQSGSSIQEISQMKKLLVALIAAAFAATSFAQAPKAADQAPKAEKAQKKSAEKKPAKAKSEKKAKAQSDKKAAAPVEKK